MNFRDALLTSFINSATSFIAGFVIFSVLGYMAHSSGQRIEDVATEGPGLVFDVYPGNFISFLLKILPKNQQILVVFSCPWNNAGPSILVHNFLPNAPHIGFGLFIWWF